MPAKLDVTGHVYGNLKVLSFAGTKKGRAMWNCECLRCGGVKPYGLGNLRSGASKQCLECANHDRANWKYSGVRAYYVWTKHKGLSTWCRRWAKYENFLNDMGHPPDDKPFLVRQYQKRSFCKSNCYWNSYSRYGIAVNIDGDSRSIQKWAEFLCVSRAGIYERMRRKGESARVAVLHFLKLYSPIVTHRGKNLPLYEWARLLGVKSNKIKLLMDSGMSAKDAVVSLMRLCE